jgi:hypothetical protein
MRKFNFIETVIIGTITCLIGLMIGSKTCTNDVTRDCLGQVQKLSYQVDSLSNENLGLKIELGRYEIIHTRLLDEFPEVEGEVTKNLE